MLERFCKFKVCFCFVSLLSSSLPLFLFSSLSLFLFLSSSSVMLVIDIQLSVAVTNASKKPVEAIKVDTLGQQCCMAYHPPFLLPPLLPTSPAPTSASPHLLSFSPSLRKSRYGSRKLKTTRENKRKYDIQFSGKTQDLKTIEYTINSDIPTISLLLSSFSLSLSPPLTLLSTLPFSPRFCHVL